VRACTPKYRFGTQAWQSPVKMRLLPCLPQAGASSRNDTAGESLNLDLIYFIENSSTIQ